jgi:hypothetical protein
MAINHIDNLKLFFMEFISTGSTAVFDHNHIEAFVRQTADG